MKTSRKLVPKSWSRSPAVNGLLRSTLVSSFTRLVFTDGCIKITVCGKHVHGVKMTRVKLTKTLGHQIFVLGKGCKDRHCTNVRRQV